MITEKEKQLRNDLKKVIKKIDKIFCLMIGVFFAINVSNKIKKQELIKKKCKDGTLTIWDLL